MTLDEYLAECKRETGLRVGSFGPRVRAFYTAVANDGGLAQKALERMESLDPGVAERDHVSRWTKEILKRALVGVD